MSFTAENILLVGSILLFVSIIVGKTGYRFGVPALLLFLVVGMLFGSDGLGFQFHSAKTAQFIGMVALSIILFSGGMDTKFTEIRPILTPGIVLSTVGVLLTALFTGLFIWWLSGMSWSNIYLPITTSLLLASTMSSTDSASVFAILRSQKMNLKHNLRPMLELESGSNDPMAYMLTIVLIQFVQSSGMGAGAILGSFFIQFLVGAAAGYVLGKLAILILNKINIDNQSLYPILLLSFVFFTFAITDRLHGNGYLAVYIAGIMVGNNKIMFRKEIATFMDGLTWLFQIIMFLMLGLLVNPHEMLEVACVALLIGVFQVLSLVPGTSRSGATIIGALLLGTSRYVAAEFTFFLAIPAMFGASLLKLVKFGFHFTGAEFGLLILGCLVSFGLSVVAIKFLMGYIKKHDFKIFGYYRIILGGIIVVVTLVQTFLA